MPPLPYQYDALEPVISSRTLHLHHDIHHQGYVDGLNRAEVALRQAREKGDFELARYWARELAFNGSGWGVLVWNPAWQRVEILQAEKHEDLTQWGSTPILVADVWEHAYYLDYQNKRAQYLDSWWNLVNWADVERRLALAIPARVPLTSN